MSNESENKLARRVDDKRAEAPLNWSEGTQATAPVPALPIPVDVMIDIETLGTAPGSAILSIGAVVFGPEGLGDTFYAPVLLQSCVAAGLTIDPNTIAWWMQQSDEARAAAFRPDADALAEVLEQFTCWFGLVGAERPWCHGATFDVPLLEVAYKACGLRAPWRFYDVRDTRTLYDLAGVKVNRAQGTHHNALDDARAQADAAVKALRVLRDRAATNAPQPEQSGIENAAKVRIGSLEEITAYQSINGERCYRAIDVERLLATTAGEQAEPARVDIDSSDFMELLCKFYHESSCEEFNEAAYKAARRAVIDHIKASRAAPAAPEQVQPKPAHDNARRKALTDAIEEISRVGCEWIDNSNRDAAAPLLNEAIARVRKLLASPSAAAPAAPEQWISTSERMPEDGETVRILCPNPTPEAWDAKWNAGSQTFESKANGWVHGDEVSHWTAKSAAPEQASGSDGTTASVAVREGAWDWKQRAEAAEAFIKPYADANNEYLAGDYSVQPMVRRLAAAILEWQTDVLKHAPDDVCGVETEASGSDGTATVGAPGLSANK